MAKTNTILQQATPEYVQRTYAVTVNALAQNGTILVTTLPAGFVVENAGLDIPAMGANTALRLGDTGDDDRLAVDADSSVANVEVVRASAGSTTIGRGYQYDTETAIYLKNTGSGTTTSSDLIVKVTIGGWQAPGGGITLDI